MAIHDPRDVQYSSKQSLRQPAPSFLAIARPLAERGFPIFPLASGTKVPAISKRDGGNGCYDGTTDAAALTTWSKNYPHANAGIRTGDGLIVLDEDRYKGADLASWDLPVPPTLRAWSARGGLHHFFSYAGILPCVNEGVLAPGVCVKADGGYVVGVGSVVEGKAYTWLDEAQPIVALPEAIAERIRNATVRAEVVNLSSVASNGHLNSSDDGTYWLDKAMARTGDGLGDSVGYWLAQQLLIEERHGAPVDVKRVLHAYATTATTNPRDPFTDRDIDRWVSSASRSTLVQHGTPARKRGNTVLRAASDYVNDAASSDAGDDGGQQQPPTSNGYHLTEMGNAERLIARYGDRLRYCFVWHKWLVWDGKRWADDSAGKTTRYAKAMVRSIYGEAEREEDEKRRAEIAKHAARSESDKAIRAALSLAQSDVPIQPDELDSSATDWLLNVQNGTLDLRRGELLKHAPAHHITKITPTAYDLQAGCPIWRAFLYDIMGGNQALITFLQRAIGYSLTGSTREQLLFIPFGTGQNGKSTLLDTLAYVLGDYATQAAPTTFMVKHGEAVPNDVARLKGARLVSAVETEEGQRLAESLVKQITGGDLVAARFMRAEFFEFRPALKLWLATNHKPVIRGTDMAIWRRIRLIPFMVTIEQPDKDLPEKLKAEAAGILAWAVQGCLDWQRDGLTCPPEVQAATDAYRGEMDMLSAFFDECCTMSSTAQVTLKALYAAYLAWCEESNEHPIAKRKFNDRIRERGIDDYRGAGNLQTWLGIGLRSN